jgi:plasmid stabilization system protein ParE
VTASVRISPEAEAELGAAALWYESKCAGLGADLLAAIDAALDRIAENPLASPLWRTGLPFRRHVVWRFPFLIFFTVSDDSVDVLAFAHAKRRPGYWMAP